MFRIAEGPASVQSILDERRATDASFQHVAHTRFFDTVSTSTALPLEVNDELRAMTRGGFR